LFDDGKWQPSFFLPKRQTKLIMRTKTVSAATNEVRESQVKKILNYEVKSVSDILGTPIKVSHILVYLNIIASLLATMMLIEQSLLLAGASLAYMAIAIAMLKKYEIKGLID